MAGVLLLLLSFLGTTTSQQQFDALGRPLFEVVTSLIQVNSHQLAVDQHRMDLINGTPIQQININPNQLPLSRVPLGSLPPSSSSLPQSLQILFPPPVKQISLHPPSSEVDGLPHLSFQSLPFPRQPQPSSPLMMAPVSSRLGILNQDRIRVEGFQPIERRTTKRRRSSKVMADWSTFEEDARSEEFLPMDDSHKLSDIEIFDRSDSAVDNDVVEDGSGNALPLIDLTSKNLHPESGYQEAVTKLSKRLPKFSNEAITRTQQDEAEEESNSILDEGSAYGEELDLTDRKIEYNIQFILAEDEKEIERKLETASEMPIFISTLSTSSVNLNLTTMKQNSSSDFPEKSLRPSQPASPNSVSFLDGRLRLIIKEHTGLIVGCILGIPAVVVLCYFIYLKRLKRYTGTLDVSARQTICHHQKSESRQTICSEENELAFSPSTCASKTPQPPPFPSCKRYVP